MSEEYSYGAIGPCGHFVAAIMDDGSEEVGKSLRKWSNLGCLVQRATVSDVKSRWCDCQKKAAVQKQLPINGSSP